MPDGILYLSLRFKILVPIFREINLFILFSNFISVSISTINVVAHQSRTIESILSELRIVKFTN